MWLPNRSGALSGSFAAGEQFFILQTSLDHFEALKNNGLNFEEDTDEQ
jgi:hypothetical protein